MSAPKPASVTTKPSSPTSLSATLSAMMELLPCAMLAKGPACTKTGVPSTVCMSVGMTVSFMSTASAPLTPRSSAVTASPEERLVPTTRRPRRSRMSARPVQSASTAMISLATEMSKPVWRVWPSSAGPCPMVTRRRWRSHVSSTRCHVTLAGSMSSSEKRTRSSVVSSSGSASLAGSSMPSLRRRRSMTGAKRRAPVFTSRGQSRSKILSARPSRPPSSGRVSWNMRESMAAASRLLAAVMAWMSPVRCRLNSSMGMTCE